jgi:hypothetical protein
MKAKYIFENIRFDRGGEPFKKLGIGKYAKGNIRSALEYDNEHELEDDWTVEWLKDNPTLAGVLEFNFSDPLEITRIMGFELDNYMENVAEDDLDEEDFMNEFTSIQTHRPGKSGELKATEGVLPDGSKVIFYQGGLVSGFITRKEWLK